MDRRFEDLQSAMEKRSAAVNKRFEDMQASTDKRFASVDKRFTLLTWMMGVVIASGLSTIGILLAM